jgi:nucleoid-associated protein EbfC
MLHVFKSLGGLGNLASMLRSAGEMNTRMQAMQDELRGKRAKGSAGAGMVEVEVNGLGEVLKVSIEPSLVEKGERELIEDLIPAAVNAAIAKSKELHVEAMKSMTEGMDLPGLDEALSQMAGGKPPQ